LDTFSIAFVCTGNRFRSPLAAAFVHRLTLGLPVRTESYGTLRIEDAPPLPEAVEIAASCGISLADHRTRFLDDVSLQKVDLLLGFEPAHVQQAVVDAQAPRERSFTLGDFVRLLPSAGPPADGQVVARARALVADAGRRSASRTGLRSASIRDPFGEPWKVYRQTASDIRELTVTLAERLFGVRDVSGLPPVPSKLGQARKTLWR
jgi:low molecular weight protein-tyrosine phosphatase